MLLCGQPFVCDAWPRRVAGRLEGRQLAQEEQKAAVAAALEPQCLMLGGVACAPIGLSLAWVVGALLVAASLFPFCFLRIPGGVILGHCSVVTRLGGLGGVLGSMLACTW
jgi:hypothetical protein